MDTEYQLLGEIQRLRKELSEIMESLHTEEADQRSFRGQLQDARVELVTVYEKLAETTVKQERCGCECCTEGAHIHADLQVSHPHRVRRVPRRLTCIKERLDSIQRNLAVNTSEQVHCSSPDSVPLEDISKEFGVGGS